MSQAESDKEEEQHVTETTVSTEFVVDKVGGKPSFLFLAIMFGLMAFNTVSAAHYLYHDCLISM